MCIIIPYNLLFMRLRNLAISSLCGFYLCMALHEGVAIITIDINNYVNYICAILQFYLHNRINIMFA